MKNFRIILGLSSLLSLGACAGTLPDTGPSASAMAQTPNVPLIEITPAIVAEMARTARVESVKRQNDAIAAISEESASASGDHILSAGDAIMVRLWTFSPFPGASSGGGGGEGALNQADLGVFQVASDGTVELPYAHKVSVRGMSMQQAQNAVSQRYTALGILQRPAVSITAANGTASSAASNEGDADGVIVTGTVGKPSILPWTSGGMTMARALTLSLGDSAGSLETRGSESSNGSHPAISVDVSRRGHKIATLPMDVALEQDIPLQPRDHLIVTKRPAIHATVLGGGARKVGHYGFADTPTLAQVLAEAQGLDPATADDSAVFVYRTQIAEDGTSNPRLYRIKWNDGASIISAQNFPIENNDVVVVGEAGIVPVTRVLSLIFQMGVMASIAK